MKRFSKYACVLVCLGLLTGLLPITYLVIQTEQQACYLRTTAFSLQWRHSVEHQLWQEHYRHDGKRILLHQTWLQTFGAGTPSFAELVKNVPAGYVGYKQDIYFHELNWVVSRRMEGVIKSEKGDIPIYQTVPDYSMITIRPAQSLLLVYLLGSSCYD